MNLYAIVPAWAPTNQVTFILAEDDAGAIEHGVFVAAKDVTDGYSSPSADVYLIARSVRRVGEAVATDAPPEWKWAHPAVEENAARWAAEDAMHEAGLSPPQIW
jgi:hypothetical protein